MGSRPRRWKQKGPRMTWLPDGLGWGATTVFAISYFCRNPQRLRLTQALAAIMWIVYGVMIHAWPVIGTNLAVAGLALASAWRDRWPVAA